MAVSGADSNANDADNAGEVMPPVTRGENGKLIVVECCGKSGTRIVALGAREEDVNEGAVALDAHFVDLAQLETALVQYDYIAAVVVLNGVGHYNKVEKRLDSMF
jgi:hypothetical protein